MGEKMWAFHEGKQWDYSYIDCSSILREPSWYEDLEVQFETEKFFLEFLF